ncbi:hypothetical protein D9M73_299190 [compost metagenome]
MPDSGPDLLQGHPGVQQALDDLEHQDVAEAVEALGPGALGSAHGGFDQAGAGPVVELAVGDSRRLADDGTPVTCVFIENRQVLGEKESLGIAKGRGVRR